MTQPPQGYANSEERIWTLVGHLGGIVIGFVAPLIALVGKGDQSPTVKAHATEALNFQITWNIVLVISAILAACSGGLLFFLPLGAGIVIVVCCIIAGVRASEGQFYTYPMTIRLVR